MAKVYHMPAKKPADAGRLTIVAVLVGIVVAAVMLALVLFALYLLAYTDWLWFGEIGLRVVFWRQIWSRLIVGVAAGAIFFVIFCGNVEIARRLSPRHRAFEGIDVVEYVNERTVQALRRGGLILSAVIAIIVGAGASADWLLFQRAVNGVPFGTRDPIFHHDIGFYVFTLPAWEAVYGLVLGALIASLVVAVIIHGALGGLVLAQQRPAPATEQPEAPRGPFGRGPFVRGPGQATVASSCGRAVSRSRTCPSCWASSSRWPARATSSRPGTCCSRAAGSSRAPATPIFTPGCPACAS